MQACALVCGHISVASPQPGQADAAEAGCQGEEAQAYSQAVPNSHGEKATFKRHPHMFRATHAPAVHKSINSWNRVNCEETFNNPPKCSIRAPQRLIRLYEVWVIAREAISPSHFLASVFSCLRGEEGELSAGLHGTPCMYVCRHAYG